MREGDIAEELGVSRTPVREAFRRLAAEGLVRHEFHRGVQVQSWSQKQLDDIFGLRAVLEPWACALAAQSGLADLPRMRDLARSMDEAVGGRSTEPKGVSAPDFVALTQLNNTFHRLITEASDNDRLVTVIGSIVEVPLVHRTFERYSRRSLERSLAHHHEIVDAIEAGDAGWAESVMRSHVRAAWSTVGSGAVEDRTHIEQTDSAHRED